MAETLTIQTTADAVCPGLTITLSGLTEADEANLATATAAYTDGYEATIVQTYGSLLFAVVADNTSEKNVVQLAVDGETAVSVPYGAYLLGGSWTADAATISDFVGESYFIPFVNTSIQVGATEQVVLSSDTKYGAATSIASAALASGGTKTFEFYMPKEPSSEPATGETVTSQGDRLNKGEKLFAWAGIGATDAAAATECFDAGENEDGLKLKLSAATLVAGSVAFAAALAF